MDMQLRVYACGSSNVARISARANLLTNMFLDFLNLRIDVARLTQWDAALWVRSRVNGGTKTAGSSARTALVLAARCTGEKFFEDSPLVKAQAFRKHGERAASKL